MTQAKHTPGPWEVSESSHVEGAGEYKRIQQPHFGGNIVGLVCVSHDLNSDLNASGYANAALIATAPELLEALKWAMSRINKKAPHQAIEGDGELYAFASAMGVIAKATGGAA